MEKKSIRTLNEYEGKILLKQWGIPVVEEALVGNEKEAVECARQLGYPVALKVCSEAVLHKTDQGGVILDIKDAGTLKRSVRDIQSRFKGTPHRLLIQKMASPGIELILGARRDPVFGPVILAGIGGVFTEVFRDTALELAPLSIPRALAMLDRLRGAALLKGFRGQDPSDLRAVAEAVTALSRLMVKRSDILEIDINPIVVRHQRCAGSGCAREACRQPQNRIGQKP